jgi:hypothetical protein
MDILGHQEGAILLETKAPPSTDSVGDCDRDFKEESRRNKKLRFSKKPVLRGFSLYVSGIQSESENPFQAHADWHHNACISNYVQFWEVGSYYVRAADALVKDSVVDRGLLDVYVSPLVFLYRHAIELFLKDLLWQIHFLACGKKGFIRDECFQTHDLLKLWQQLKENCQKVLGPDFPFAPHEIEAVEQLFVQIQKHDPRSDAFRFPFDVKGNRSHVSLSHVNVRSLYECVHQRVDLLGNLRAIVTYYMEGMDS